MKNRVYSRYQNFIECHVYEGNKHLAHLIYYPAKSYYCPRYHFENFNLLLPELNYEICLFMKRLQKILSNPYIDLDSLNLPDMDLFNGI